MPLLLGADDVARLLIERLVITYAMSVQYVRQLLVAGVVPRSCKAYTLGLMHRWIPSITLDGCQQLRLERWEGGQITVLEIGTLPDVRQLDGLVSHD